MSLCICNDVGVCCQDETMLGADTFILLLGLDLIGEYLCFLD